jgi:hypothetical protein
MFDNRRGIQQSLCALRFHLGEVLERQFPVVKFAGDEGL